MYSEFINYIGAITRWLFGKLRFLISGGPKFSFREYLNGPDNGDEIIDTYGHGIINWIIGIVVFFALLISRNQSLAHVGGFDFICPVFKV